MKIKFTDPLHFKIFFDDKYTFINVPRPVCFDSNIKIRYFDYLRSYFSRLHKTESMRGKGKGTGKIIFF